MNLPDYLQDLSLVLFDSGVAHTPLVQRVQKRLPAHIPWQEAGDSTQASLKLDAEKQNGKILYLKEYKGRFLRPCPGTRHYNCCSYQIIHIGENCPLNCSYCILKAYFQDQVLKVWANQDRLFSELEQEFTRHPQKKYRMGTGEFTDSLALESLTCYSADLVDFLGNFSNTCLELKTKVVDLSWCSRVRDPRRILPAWSMNAVQIQKEEEKGVSCLEERLQAAKTCVVNGFRVCLHFDPIIYYPGWEQGYSRTIEMIADYLQARDIAYLSLGSFRCMPDLKKFIQKNWPNSRYIYSEFITGLDGKMRLLRPLRVKQFRFIVDRLRKMGLDRQLYFCMESNEVWQAVLGYTPRELGGLAQHLLKQAFQ